jgi:short subunit dehydrogenase-like uncharacterized protein
MSAINTRVVHRTNALSERAYGADFAYDEAMLTGRGLKGQLDGAATVAGLAGFMVAGAIGPLRGALERFVLPKPGEGPSPDEQRQGLFDLRFVGTTPDGRQIRTRVTGDRDPGYGSTGKMLGQAAACLALDVDRGTPSGGFWTPATIFGDRLIQRLINMPDSPSKWSQIRELLRAKRAARPQPDVRASCVPSVRRESANE